jgi:hypothetical protein
MKFLLAAIFILSASFAFAHTAPSGMKYDAYCCKGTEMHGDCAPIPFSDVQTTSKGWVITLHPGDHPMVTKVHVFTKEYGSERHSTDGQYHICLFPNENNVQCFYAPPPNS